MTKTSILLILIFISSFASAVCGQSYVSDMRALETYREPIKSSKVVQKIEVIQIVTREAVKAKCLDVESVGLDLLSIPLTSALESVNVPAVTGVLAIAENSPYSQIKVKALEVLRPSVHFRIPAVRKEAIFAVQIIASYSSDPAVVAKAKETLHEAQISVYQDARSMAEAVVQTIENTATR